MQKQKLIANVPLIAAVLFLIAAAVFYFVIYRTEISEFDLRARNADVAGVAQGSSFLLKTTADLTPQVIHKYIKVAPEVELAVKKVEGEENTFEVIPKEQLQADTIYVISIDEGPLASRDFSWAYQIKAPFAVTSSVPGNQATEVPVRTGIEIDFNREHIIDPEAYIKITPAVKGKFHVSGNKVRFVPEENLAAETVYTVIVNQGLRAEGTNDMLAEAHTIQFETSQYRYEAVKSAYFQRTFSEVVPESDVILGVTSNSEANTVQAAVYRFDSASEFIQYITKPDREMGWTRYYHTVTATFPEEKKVFSGSLPLGTLDYAYSLKLPQVLSAGYYAVLMETKTSKDIAWLQVHPVASFSALASGKSLVWLKDSASGANIEKAEIVWNNSKIGETKSDGIALFSTPQELVRKEGEPYSYHEKRSFFIARTPKGELVIPVENEYGYQSKIESPDRWWDYIATNKNVYLPTDTLRFWGVLKPRGGNIAGEEISVTLTKPYWDYSTANEATVYAEAKLPVSSFHGITGELSFANLRPGIYELTFKKGEAIIAKHTITIAAYIPPAYKMSIMPDKNAIFAGESVTFDVKAEFFDGTPVSNTAIRYRIYGLGSEMAGGTAETNAAGRASFSISPPYTEDGAYGYAWPRYMSVYINPTAAEAGDIQANTQVMVFGPDFQNSIKREGRGEVTFTVTSKSIDLKKGQSEGTPYWSLEEYLGTPCPGIQTTVTVEEVLHLKDQTGTGYDPINKVSYPIYDYRTEYQPLSSATVTGDRDGRATFTLETVKDKTYRVTFSARDEKGRLVKDQTHVYGNWSDIDYYDERNSYIYTKTADNKLEYEVSEPFELSLQTNTGVAPKTETSQYLFIFAVNGELEYRIEAAPAYRGTFEEKYVPNVGVWPAWFSNGRFRNGYLTNLSLDADSRRLNIDITKDKESYRPGEDVVLDIRVTDRKNIPVESEVNLSALDEAVFSIQSGERDFVNNLYRDIYSPLLIRTSHEPPYGGGGAEKGGGDGDTPRSDIQELALFKSVKTDATGRAKVQFKLPDNITSWRLTTHAVTDGLLGGKAVNFIPVSLPFFVDVTLNKTYLAGDELNLRLRTFGTSLSYNTVSYSLEASTLPFKRKEFQGQTTVQVPVGKLTAGEHPLTVRAAQGSLKDALTRQITVVPTYFTKQAAEFYEGAPSLSISNEAPGYTTLVFTELLRGKIYNDLKGLSYSHGLRIDQRGASYVARKLLKKYFNEETGEKAFDGSKYQHDSGAVQLLPYSSEDLEVTAFAAHLFKEGELDQDLMKEYLSNSLKDEKSDVKRIVRALFGLAALREPVLVKIQNIKDEKTLELKDKLFIALSLAELGAKEEARTYYAQEIAGKIKTKQPYAYLDLKGDEAVLGTALVSALAAKLDLPEGALLYNYAIDHYPKETVHSFERLLYIQTAVATMEPETVRFAYTAGEKSGEKILKNGEQFSIMLSKEELRQFRLSSVEGELGIAALYEVPSSPDSIKKDESLSLSRTYSVDGAATTIFEEGDIIKISLTPYFKTGSLSGAYEVVDYVPSGLRPIDREASRYWSKYDSRIYPIEIQDQKVTFYTNKGEALPMYYFARVVSKGVYKAESALMQSLKSLESATISDEEIITVK